VKGCALYLDNDNRPRLATRVKWRLPVCVVTVKWHKKRYIFIHGCGNGPAKTRDYSQIRQRTHHG
jgi:hypothetical protein